MICFWFLTFWWNVPKCVCNWQLNWHIRSLSIFQKCASYLCLDFSVRSLKRTPQNIIALMFRAATSWQTLCYPHGSDVGSCRKQLFCESLDLHPLSRCHWAMGVFWKFLPRRWLTLCNMTVHRNDCKLHKCIPGVKANVSQFSFP